jgi:predicted phage terminase large subunit-like protein
MSNPQELDLLRKIATPSRIGQYLGRDLWGVDYVPYPFVLEMEQQVIEAAVSDQDHFIMVNAPPQTGKSSFSGILFPFWFIGMFPDKQVIFVTYSDDYSRNFGRTVRDLFARYGEELFGVRVDPHNDSAGDWKLLGHQSGGMLSVGIGSQITGRQGHLVIIDDVLKNMEEASSVTTKRKHLRDFDGTILTRRQPGCTYLITATRFAEDDLSGALWERGLRKGYQGDQWDRIVFPAICEPPEEYDGSPSDYKDSLGRKTGEPLECRFSQPSDSTSSSHFHKLKATIDPFIFACLYQQNPVSNEGGMFPADDWKYLQRADWPDLHTLVRVWDVASTEGGGDWTVGTLMGRSVDGDLFIVDRYRDQRGPDQVLADIKATALRDGPHIPILIEQERSGAGAINLEFYRRELTGFMVEPAKADGPKEVRARQYSIMQRGGHVFLPADEDDRTWVTEWVKEHKGMMGDGRRPRHDDQIDTGAYAVRYLLDHGIVDIVDPNDLEFNFKSLQDYEDLMFNLGASVETQDVPFR